MSVLLDTHVWLWWLLGSEQLPARERAALDRLAASGSLHLAAVSLWEAQMLHSKGRLDVRRAFGPWLRDAASPIVVQVEPLDIEIVLAVSELPTTFHGDPADRLIVATARSRRLALATYDRAIVASGAATHWEA